MSRQQLIGKLAVAALVACALDMSAGAASAETLATATPQSFQASGAEISGWTWLRSQGNSAEWTWAALQSAPRAACVNFSLLVTNTVNGGSGHDGRIQVVIVPDGARERPVSLTLKNPFRPVVDSNTNGVGYQAYGAICSSEIARAAGRGLHIRMEWNSSARGHVAVREQGAVLAYEQ